MSDQLSTKSISQLCSTTLINGADLFFISKYDKLHESGLLDWRSYKINFDSIERYFDDRYMNINEDFLTSDALVDLSDKWELAYSNTEILCADLRKISRNLSANIKYLSSLINNSSLSINNLCLEIKNIDGNLTSYIPKTDIVLTLGNSTTKVPSLNLLSTELNNINKVKQDQLFGKLGEIAYLKNDGVIKQELLANNTYVCQNDEEIQICKGSEISFKDVYENWVKVANNGSGIWYGHTSNYPIESGTSQAYGIKKWYYDSEKDSIILPNNVNDTEGFVSNEKYKNFDITVRCYSTNTDDDTIGVIAGYAIDKNLNKPCMIVFIRLPNNSPQNNGEYNDLEKFLNYIGHNRWVLLKFYPTSKVGIDNTAKLPVSEAVTLSSDIVSHRAAGQTDYKVARGWKALGKGCLVRVKRVNDMLSAWTTPFSIDKSSISQTELTAMVTLDLKSDSKLSSLLEGGAIGYCTQSLAMTMYLNIDFKVEKSVVDTRTNLLSVLNPFTGDWQLCSNVIPMDYVGYGREITNDLTKKTFYSGNNSFKLIATKNTEDDYIKKNSGLEGDVVYRTQDPSSRKMTYMDLQIVNLNVLVCETEEEFNRCKDAAISFKDVFDTWTKFGHYQGKQYGKDSDYTGGGTPGYDHWSYNDSNKTILESANSTDFTGFVSVKKHRDYSFAVRCYSTNTDDDFNGIVAAFATDSTGKQHTLSFLRTPNNTNTELPDSLTHHWYCVLDCYLPFYPKTTSYGQKLIKNSTLTKDNEPSGRWSSFLNFGVLIRVERQGNVFRAWTTDFSNTPLTTSSLKNEMVIDLNLVINDSSLGLTEQNKAALRLFIDLPVSIGYCTHSLPLSMYENWEMPETDRMLIRLTDKTVWKYSFSSHSWVQDTSMSYIKRAGIGRFSYNSVTNKTFYNNGNSIFNVTRSLGAKDIWTGTLAEYNALTNKNPNTIYYCKE